MMAMTTSISTRVKPASRSSLLARADERRRRSSRKALLIISNLLIDDLIDREQRRHHGHDQPADDQADDDNSERADNSNGAIEASLEFRLVEIGKASGKHRQLTRVFSQAERSNRHP